MIPLATTPLPASSCFGGTPRSVSRPSGGGLGRFLQGVLDLGCGHGVPISQVLIQEGFVVYGVDASPAMVAAFHERFPQAHVACEAVEDSGLFGRTFDAVVAWGLLFLLAADAQEALIHRIASVLLPGGSFLLTAPEQTCTWTDMLTGRQSISLGNEGYRTILAAAGLERLADAAGRITYSARANAVKGSVPNEYG
ncbi:MAG TPA: class I SAM-dependent methyltransferase [Thermoanaerobaculia bacterium]|nr:class I SAM-dependent methyltransferase [Thermoanaerobaculia bacterium]